MPKIHFKRTVIKAVTPLLAPFGYHLDDAAQTVTHFLFFEKLSLEEKGVKFFIGFQLGQHYIPPRRSFTVELRRCKGSFFKPDRDYEKMIGWRLTSLIWNYYKLRLYPQPSYWWEFENDEELKVQLEDAVEKVIKYGIPWLEDPNAVPPQEFM